MNAKWSWPILIAAVGMLLGLVSVELASLHTWQEVFSVPVMGKLMAHIATVIAAWWSGKLAPQPVTTPPPDPDRRA